MTNTSGWDADGRSMRMGRWWSFDDDWTRCVPSGDSEVLDRATAMHDVKGCASKGMMTVCTLLLVSLRGSTGFGWRP
jgi:hypothetical protein